MEIIGINNVREIATDKFSVSQRGLLITIFILKENDSKLTLAKFKSQIKIAEHRDDLIDLHERKIIKWSGYKPAIKSKEQSSENIEAMEAIEYFNNLCGTRHEYNSKGFYSNLVNRLKEYPLDTIKLVFANRYAVWKDDSYMSKYLKPDTILRPSKFSIYLEEAQRTKVGESFLNASKVGLNDGDVITFELSQTFVDNDVYSVITFRLNESGERVGSGQAGKEYGKDLKRKLKVQHSQLEYSYKDFEIVYKTK